VQTNTTVRVIFHRAVCIAAILLGLFWVLVYSLEIAGVERVFNTSHPHASSDKLFLLPMLLFSILSVAAVLLMWNYSKKGFYLYFASLFLLLNYPLLFRMQLQSDLSELFFVSVFLVIFGINLGILSPKKKTPEIQQAG
jgi:ABC-type proline/glycine betaine transport system permease subunit